MAASGNTALTKPPNGNSAFNPQRSWPGAYAIDRVRALNKISAVSHLFLQLILIVGVAPLPRTYSTQSSLQGEANEPAKPKRL